MEKKIIVTGFLLGLCVLFFNPDIENKRTTKAQKKYNKARKEHSFSKTLQLSKDERKALGIPPNKYFEEKYLLEMNPYTGKTHPENVYNLSEALKASRFAQRTPGDGIENDWEERGPNNVGGRTRVILFDPNDATHKRVFAGGVSGGLWVNEDITDSNSSWSQVGIDENVSISCMAVDPNNSQIMYVGTGELYTQNDALGNGVWRSTDGGTTWANIYKVRGTTSGGTVSGTYYTTDIIVRDADGNSATTNDSEVFVAVGASYYDGNPVSTFVGASNYGLFKSTDTGSNWARVTLNNAQGRREAPNDLEIGSDNTLWIGTTRNVYGDSGGSVYNSTNGSTFTLKHTIANARRTEIAVSKTDPNKIYALAQLSTDPVGIYLTTDAFATTPTTLALPNDTDTGIPTNDFTRGQAFYDLMLAVDPTNDDIAYVGGIDLFRTSDSGTSWNQISKWSNNNDLAALSVSTVHADQHGWAFHPTDANIAVSGNDGGVFYASSLSTASSNTTAISARNKGYNVTQFYKGAIGQSTGTEYLLAGAQDNGTQFVNGASTGINSTITAFGGDGGYCFIDKDDAYMTVSYTNNYIVRLNLPYTGGGVILSEDTSTGSFINSMELDDNLDILYTNGTTHLARFSGITTATAIRTDFADPLLTNISAIKVSPYTTGSSTVFVGTSNGTLAKVENLDTATTVADLTISNISGGSFLGSISSIEFGVSEDEILVTFHNFGVTSVWYSSNGGTNWSNKEGDFPDIPVKAILMNPLNNDEVIVGTELGVWKTANFSDAVPRWTQSYNGMSSVAVTSFDLRTGDNTVLASTYGRGMFTGKFIGNALTTTTWTGAVDTDWANGGNWSNGIPGAGADAIIPNVAMKPSINTSVALRSLVIENESSLTLSGISSLSLSGNMTNNGTFSVNSGGSLIIAGIVTGKITYNLAIVDTNWHLVSSPVINEQYDDVWAATNAIASGLGNNKGIATYDNRVPDATTAYWRYMQAGGAATFTTGIGYSALRGAIGDFSFTGNFPTSDVTPAISQNNQNWNLIGNPYPSYLDVAAFITANTSNITGAFQAVYVWDGISPTTGNYTSLTTGYIQPGQGFFINSNLISGTASITEAMQSHQTGVSFYRTENPSIYLTLFDGTNSKETQIIYLEGKTKGLDLRFDIGMFDGTSSSLRIYTQLLEDNQGVRFSKQALPNSNFESMIVPIGVKAAAGKEITFSLDALNLPIDMKVFLEDKETNTFTRLDEADKKYSTIFAEDFDGVGRFFLHTSRNSLNIKDFLLEDVRIYKINPSTLRIVGIENSKTSVMLFSLLGKQVLKTSFISNGTKDISLPKLAAGVYFIQIHTNKGELKKKIILE
jgi:hypothetical protein